MLEVTPYQCSTRSVIALVSAYTLSGPMGADSFTGTVAGVPYTEHDEENTNCETPAPNTASMSRAEPSTLLRQYLAGLRMDSPTFLCAAKWMTELTL
ncbi:unannotated protein [freshwater metagenome]|uniref:Unannotated protein n=1 Tax=freshwater metagenome TaxID=449393 RepID=A0A6J7EVL8_9ZZZZ